MQNGNRIVEIILGTGVALFPSIGFLYQYRLIHKRKSVGTFSINVCGVMFLSNFLRIAFFLYKEFSVALLAQSIINIIMQLLLLSLCVKTMNLEGYFQKHQKQIQSKEQSFLNTFWKWKQLSKYYALIAFQAIIILGIGLFIRKYDITYAGQTLGYIALIAETFLLIPQLLQNLKQERVKGISYIFILLNTLQDLLELIFVIIYSQPLQFLIFNLLQVITNLLLILQVIIYKNCCSKGCQYEESHKMVQRRQTNKQEQILSGHEIVHPIKQKVKEATKLQLSPLKGVDGQQIQQNKTPLAIIAE